MAVGAIAAIAALITAAVLVLGQTANGGSQLPSALRSPSATPNWSPAAPVLVPASSGAAPPPSRAGLARRLDPLLATPALGSLVGATVVDAASGEVLWERGGTRPLPPASNVKVATAAAVLAAAGPQTRFSTRVVRGAIDDIVLVGGGDPTLTAAGRRAPDDPYTERARIPTLARATAAALRETGVASVRVSVDDSRFVGPRANPAWAGRYVSSGNVLPVSALTLDADANRPRKGQLGADQAMLAGRAFAAALAKQGIAVRAGVSRQRAAAGAVELASADSPPLAAIVEEMLATSDNDVAEILARQVAVAADAPPTFAGAAAAVTTVLQGLGVEPAGMRLLDGSGLARGNRISSRTLARIVAIAASPAHAELRAAVSGLPVAGFTGTLSDRFDASATRRAAGIVRAKTGTLAGVSSLTGVAYDADGRVLAFSFIAAGVQGGTGGAEAVLDRLAATLAGCGCR
jgi:D-alanyl-D-alanine carboxypeptidase